MALLLGCGPAGERFSGTFESPEALTEEFLRRLQAGDRDRLESLALTEGEFQKEAFPEMPAYGSVPGDFAWSQLRSKSHYGLSSILHYRGGRSYELERITYAGGHTAYDTFVVHRKPSLHLRSRETGETETIALFGSILEHGGRYKLFSFNIRR